MAGEVEKLQLLRLEVAAIRDRLNQDMDAILARIDEALPPVDLRGRYRKRSQAEWREELQRRGIA